MHHMQTLLFRSCGLLGVSMTMIRDIVTAVLEREIGDSDDIFVAGGVIGMVVIFSSVQH